MVRNKKKPDNQTKHLNYLKEKLDCKKRKKNSESKTREKQKTKNQDGINKSRYINNQIN